MKFIFTIFMLFMATYTAMAQTAKVDTSYIKTYEQKILLQGYVSTNTIQVVNGSKTYNANYPLNVGFGFALKNTIINATYDFGLIPLKGKEYGKTNLNDLQIHNYSTHFMLDIFLQKYSGFYSGGLYNQPITLYPNLSVSQVGAEGSYVFNGNQFSGKAAFEQSEKQLISAGSFIIGGGVYLYRVGLDSNMLIAGNRSVRDLQLGLNLGYVYSWVLGDFWLLSGMAKIGANGGNQQQYAGTGNLKIYPTAFARGSATYAKPNWAVSYLMLINDKSVYAFGNRFDIASINFQLSYVRHLNSIFKRKKNI
ncbi:protein of unknown function [Mucilaginibacter mallensis]|uniref:DUF4421 domain-containing protein n=1 Tax=Mucilaginibacter mallensis TaxID=652787 RepID=A0A1H2CF54_MUCMA|nr:DUF4421 family protein [Mucilaginibacter mallensis]SDT69175.1 protein of unknown function [Mucilaginibacter mallensis]